MLYYHFSLQQLVVFLIAQHIQNLLRFERKIYKRYYLWRVEDEVRNLPARGKNHVFMSGGSAADVYMFLSLSPVAGGSWLGGVLSFRISSALRPIRRRALLLTRCRDGLSWLPSG